MSPTNDKKQQVRQKLNTSPTAQTSSLKESLDNYLSNLPRMQSLVSNLAESPENVNLRAQLMGDLIAKGRVYLTGLRTAARNRTFPKDTHFTTFSKVIDNMEARDLSTQQSLAEQNGQLARMEERYEALQEKIRHLKHENQILLKKIPTAKTISEVVR